VALYEIYGQKVSLHCKKFVFFVYNPNKKSTDSIALSFLCLHTCYPLKLRYLSYLGKRFSVPCWRKSIPHCGGNDFALDLQRSCKIRRQFRAVCATFKDLRSYEIIHHVTLYTVTHTCTFIDEKDAHCFNKCLSRHLYFLLSFWCFPVKHSVLPANVITKIRLTNSCRLQVHPVLMQQFCLHVFINARLDKRELFSCFQSLTPWKFSLVGGKMPV
jgi:hypothetical protein